MYDLVRVACDIMDLAKLNVSLMRRLMNHGSLGKRSEARLQAMRVKLRSMVDEGILIEDEHDIRSGLSLTIPEDTKHPALRHLDRSSYGYRLA